MRLYHIGLIFCSESERPSKRNSPTSACEDSAENVGEPTRDSSDFEVCSPVKKTIRRSSKRRLSLSDDSDSSESDSEQETVRIVERKKSLDSSLRQKTKKRRTAKPPPLSDSEGPDEGDVGGKRRKRGSGDAKQVVSLINNSDSESGKFGNSPRSRARRNGNKMKAKRKKREVSDSECEETGRNDGHSGESDGGAETTRDSRRRRQVSDSDSTCDHLTGDDDDAVSKTSKSVNRTDKKARKAEMDKEQITVSVSKCHGKKPNSNIALGKSHHSRKLDSGDSSGGVAEPEISETIRNSRKRGDVSDSESTCNNLTSDDDSVRKNGKSVKRTDKRKNARKGASLGNSGADQRVGKNIGVSERRKISPKGREPKSNFATGESKRKQKQNARRKSKNRAPSSSDSESSTSKSAAKHRDLGREKKHTTQRKRSSAEGRVASSSDEELPPLKATRHESQVRASRSQVRLKCP